MIRALFGRPARWSVLFVFCWLSGCQAVSSVRPPQTLLGKVSELLPGLEVARNSHFQLPQQARVLVVVQAESRAENERALIDASRRWFAAHHGSVSVAPEPLLPEEARALAVTQEADFLLMARVVDWPVEASVQEQCPFESHPACQTLASGEPLWISLRVDDVGTGRVVDTLSVRQPESFPTSAQERGEIAADALKKMFGILLP